MRRSKLIRLIALLFAGALLFTACSEDDDGDESSDTTEEESTDTTAAEEEAAPEDAGTIVDIAAGDEQFSTLVTAVTEAELAETLSGEGPYTVFAPTNEAFEALPAGTLDELLADPTGALADVLTYHVVEGAVLSGDLTTGEVPTVNGATLDVVVNDDGTVTVNGVNVVTADIEASNGVIHVIDGVLVPEG
jgi:uncharacterized surface protein with fasciclin (FAS1) repeats